MQIVQRILFTTVIVLLFAVSARADVILSTDFNGRTVSGKTASNLTWVTNGVSNPGNLTASHDLFDTAAAQNRFAVDRNLHNEGSWSVDIPLNVGNAPIDLANLDLDVFIFSNSGALQTAQRDVDITVELLDSMLAVIDSATVSNIYANSGTAVQPQGISLDFTGNTLSGNSNFTLRITASGTGPGNNAGIDNFVLNGQIVPEPTTLAIIGFGTLCVTAFGVVRSRGKKNARRIS